MTEKTVDLNWARFRRGAIEIDVVSMHPPTQAELAALQVENTARVHRYAVHGLAPEEIAAALLLPLGEVLEILREG